VKKYLFWLCLLLAFAGGIFTGWVDFNNDEVQAAVLVILAVTFLLGMILPRRAWLWAIIVALCLPGVYLIAVGLGYQPVSPPSPGWYASLIALIPAFIGAYTGALARVAINSVTATSSSQNGK
jgi:hypothetical protein